MLFVFVTLGGLLPMVGCTSIALLWLQPAGEGKSRDTIKLRTIYVTRNSRTEQLWIALLVVVKEARRVVANHSLRHGVHSRDPPRSKNLLCWESGVQTDSQQPLLFCDAFEVLPTSSVQLVQRVEEDLTYRLVRAIATRCSRFQLHMIVF